MMAFLQPPPKQHMNTETGQTFVPKEMADWTVEEKL